VAHVVSNELCRFLKAGMIVPVVGWGHPDLVLTPPPIPIRRPADTDTCLRAIDDWLAVHSPSLMPLYQAVAELPAKCVLSFTPDRQLGRVLEYHDPAWSTLRRGQTEFAAGSRILIPMMGTAEDPGTLALTERHLLGLDQSHAWFHAHARATQAPLLVLGVDPADRLLLSVIAQLRPKPPFQRAGWLLCRAISLADQRAWEGQGFVVETGPPARFLREIAGQTSEMTVPARTSSASKDRRSPYKKLDYFERDESDLFFGREGEVERLTELVCGHRIVVVTGPSGAGKTSLINAGLLSWVDGIGREVGLYVRVGQDPIASIRVAAARLCAHTLEETVSLDTVLRTLRDETQRLPIVVLDQAEELFTRIGTPMLEDLAGTLRSAITATPLIARFVVCLREDYLPRMISMRQWVPSILQCVFYLHELDRVHATAAIRKPAEAVGVHFSPVLAEKIVKELGTTLIPPPQIQIICSRLFEQCEGAVIDEALYAEMGGSKALLRSFLSEELSKLEAAGTQIRNVLKAMVTSEGTKEPLTVQDVSRRTRESVPGCHGLLLQLRDGSRLLRSIQVGKETCFELAHEYLTGEIWSWMTPEDIRRRELEGLMDREVRSWRRFKQLRLGLDRLRLFEANRHLVEIENDALVLILLSCVKNQQSATAWLPLVRSLSRSEQDHMAERLFEYFRERDICQRRDAAEVIGVIDHGPLLRALKSSEELVCVVALEMIGGLELREATVPIIQLMRRKDLSSRLWIASIGALGEIGGPEAERAIREVPAEAGDRVVGAATRAAGRIGTRSMVRIVRAALTSHLASLKTAARDAIVSSRSPHLVKGLLRDGAVKGKARDLLWKFISQAESPLQAWVEEALPKLDLPDLERAVEILSLKRTALKGIISKGDAQRAAQAKRDVAVLEQDDADRARVTVKVASSLLEDASVAEVVKCLGRGWHHLWATARRISTFKNLSALVKEMAADDDEEVRLCALASLYFAVSRTELPDSFYRTAIDDSAPGIRYMACLAAGDQGRTSVVESVAKLIGDTGESNWYIIGIGPRVSSAASSALDKLRPNSKVWRKPFQTSFGT